MAIRIVQVEGTAVAVEGGPVRTVEEDSLVVVVGRVGEALEG